MCRERERDDSKDDDNDDLLLSIWRKNIFTRRNDDNDILSTVGAKRIGKGRGEREYHTNAHKMLWRLIQPKNDKHNSLKRKTPKHSWGFLGG